MNYRRPNYKQTTTMNEPKHTPGPWHLSNLAANGEQEICVSRSSELGGASICVVESSRRADTLLADARLIAAAPELLAVLKAIADHTRYMEEQDGWPEIQEAMDAAIAKAEGGQP